MSAEEWDRLYQLLAVFGACYAFVSYTALIAAAFSAMGAFYGLDIASNSRAARQPLEALRRMSHWQQWLGLVLLAIAWPVTVWLLLYGDSER